MQLLMFLHVVTIVTICIRADQQQSAAAANRKDILYPPGSSEDRAAWISAWRLVGHHTWRLLDQGRLKAAARLGHSLMEVGASLPALLLACPDGAREGLPSPDACLAGGSWLDLHLIMS